MEAGIIHLHDLRASSTISLSLIFSRGKIAHSSKFCSSPRPYAVKTFNFFTYTRYSKLVDTWYNKKCYCNKKNKK